MKPKGFFYNLSCNSISVRVRRHKRTAVLIELRFFFIVFKVAKDKKQVRKKAPDLRYNIYFFRAVLPARTFLSFFQNIGNSPAGKAVAVRIACVRHCVIRVFILKQLLEVLIYNVLVCSDKL